MREHPPRSPPEWLPAFSSLLLTGRAVAGRDVHFGALRGAGVRQSLLVFAVRDVHFGALRGAGVRQSLLVFAVLFVHSLPEGMAMGTAYASNRAGLGLFV